MSDEEGGYGEPGGFDDGDLPEATLETRSGFSLVWIIPIVAALIGGWIAWRAYSESGPTITISFQSAEGLEAGTTEVKFKDLTVGLVQSIELAEDLSHVIVAAEMSPGATRYLTSKTRFWVVRPQITAGGATGLGTLLSGAYVGMDPVMDGRPRTKFKGLEQQPLVTTGDKGTLFTLRSRILGSASIGSPVYYRRISVGKVVSFEISQDGETVDTRVFVEAPHDQRVSTNTRFWDASGLDVTMNAEGLQLDTISIVSLLIGAVGFETPDGVAGDPVTEDTVFSFYPNRSAARERSYAIKRRYLLNFAGAVEGLYPGSPVVLHGIRVGEVVDVRLQFDWKKPEVIVPVVIEIEPERFELIDSALDEENPTARLEHLVANGFRAQLGTANFLTGELQVELDFHAESEPAEVGYASNYPEIPTVSTPLEDIDARVATIVRTVENMPLDDIAVALRDSLVELRSTLRNVGELSAGFDEDVMPSLKSMLENLETTSESVNELIGTGSPMPLELQRAIEEISRAAQSARLLTDYLERHPEALIRGKNND